MANELWHHFDRIRDFLLKQESRGRDGAWLVRALPHIARHLEAVTAAEEQCYGATLCTWQDWLDARNLAFRGKLKWQIPTGGPLIFTPPSMEGLMNRLGQLLRDDGLVEYTLRMSRSMTAGPAKKTKKQNPRRKRNA